MFRIMMKSKIHSARITQANLLYEGSITIDEDLMEKADILLNERVQVVNVNNGARFETYVIKGERGSGSICLNGPAARLGTEHDVIHIISYAHVDESERDDFHSTVIILHEDNTIKKEIIE